MSPSDLIPSHTGQVYLDHVGLFVTNFINSAEQLNHLGFTLTPFVTHMNAAESGAAPMPSGTGNHCAMFQEGYLEVLGRTSDTPLSRQLQQQLERYPGLHLIAFAANNASTRYTQLQSRGFELLPIVNLERQVDTSNGEEATAQFTVIRPKPGAMPEGRIQIVTHHTPELAWQPRYQQHPNGVEALSGVLICVTDPDEAAERFACYLNQPVLDTKKTPVVQLQRGCLSFVTAEQLKKQRPGLIIPSMPYIAEIELRCTDLAQTESFFQQRAINYQKKSDGTLYLTPDTALGMAITFHDQAAPNWP